MNQPAPQQEQSPVKSPALWLSGLLAGASLLLMTFILPAPDGMSVMAWHCAGLAMMMAVFWSLEILPIPVTALMPLLFAPLMGLTTLNKAASSYAHPVIYLFMGGFMLGLAMEKWNLHRRLALWTMLKSGTGERRQVIGFMLATAFISMWVSNTATAIMMLPIGISVIAMMQQERGSHGQFPTALLLAIAYGASIGGFGTLIGTPPNALLAAFLSEQYGLDIGFGQWLLIGVPVMLLMLMVTGWWLGHGGYKLESGESSAIRETLKEHQADLGSFSKAEKWVASLFGLTATAWIIRPWLNHVIPGINLTDTTIALLGGCLLFVIPIQFKKLTFLLSVRDIRRLPWDVLMLFGGGLSLAGIIRETGLAEWIATNFNLLEGLPTIVVIAVVVAVIIFLTEITSNTATTAAFLPPLGALAVSLGMTPEMLAIPAAIAASCAFMLPVATPPNAIVFGAGMLSIRQMVRSGAVLNLAGILLITGLCYLLI
ncbi:anion transporter [Endozoicomonas sp. OPT23]|uniref:SLC13 family permease n=1 Tax=Endozoicomonas sp. OPT23 TaxID=2072845 RepID=UPI00129A6E97|nr:DASS family sodium-coupled anion symporter [Endozoicomonas sp. OPT23]MRI32753.1 anion transporter [Endozoicomonas sp. OPT23]